MKNSNVARANHTKVATLKNKSPYVVYKPAGYYGKAGAAMQTKSGYMIQKPVGYYTNWDTYGREFQPTDIQWSKISVALYAFAESGTCAAVPTPSSSQPNEGLTENVSRHWAEYEATGKVPCPDHGTIPGLDGKLDHKLHSSDPVSDLPSGPENGWGKDNIGQFVRLAKENNVPAIISVGGWTYSISLLDSIIKDPKGFSKSIVDFVNKHNFDGVDIDLEPYENNWTRAKKTDIMSFVDFMRTLRADLPEGKLLTAALSTHPASIKAIGEYNIAWLDGVLDHLYVMSYDMRGAWDSPKVTNFHTAFKYDANQPADVENREILNVVASIKTYLEMGMTPSKIHIGYAGYGHVLSAVAPGANGDGVYQKFDGSGPGLWESGKTSYWKILEGINTGAIVETFNQGSQSVSGYNAADKIFISYDNPKTVQIKACYALYKKLGGTMTWSLYDDKDSVLLNAAQPGKSEDNCCEKVKIICQELAALGGSAKECATMNAFNNAPIDDATCSQYYQMFSQAESDAANNYSNIGNHADL